MNAYLLHTHPGQNHGLSATDPLMASVTHFVESARTFDPSALNAAVLVGTLISDICMAVAFAEQNGMSREEILAKIAPVRVLVAQSPFYKHAQEWPRGYVGDFEIIEQLVFQRTLAAEKSFAWFVETAVLENMVSQHYRNKIAYQADLIMQAALATDHIKKDHPRKVLSIASGGNNDLRAVQKHVAGQDCQFVLNDADKDALAFAQTKLNKVINQCTFIPGNIFRSISRLAEFGPYDLVIAGGLFDYLTPRYAKFLIENIIDKLCISGGFIYFSNIVKGNPYRYLMEYLFDWPLIERDENDALALLQPFNDLIQNIELSRDLTGLSILTLFQKR